MSLVCRLLESLCLLAGPQPGVERDLDVLRTINRERATFLGVGGTTNLLVAVGDGGTIIYSPNDTMDIVVTNETGISTQTVKHHLTSIFDKTGVSTRLALAIFAIRHDLAGDDAPGSRGAEP